MTAEENMESSKTWIRLTSVFFIYWKNPIVQIGILPAIAWNYYNKLMLGVFLYSPL